MTLTQLKYVITIADTGSMNEAAKLLFISQPSLSLALKELEHEIAPRFALPRSQHTFAIRPVSLLAHVCLPVKCLHIRASKLSRLHSRLTGLFHHIRSGASNPRTLMQVIRTLRVNVTRLIYPACFFLSSSAMIFVS